MTNLLYTLFGPLDKNACALFFYISAFFFIVLVIVFFYEMVYLLKALVSSKSNLTFRSFFHGIIMLINLYFLYFFYRLFYTMCNKSLA